MSTDGAIQSKLWKEWLASPEGKNCANGTATGKYLENRLYRAFMDGYNACVVEVEKGKR